MSQPKPKNGTVELFRTIPRPRVRKLGQPILPDQRRNFLLHAYALAWDYADSEGKIHNAEWSRLIQQQARTTPQQAKRLRKQLHDLEWVLTTRGSRYSAVTQDPANFVIGQEAEIDAAIKRHPASRVSTTVNTSGNSPKFSDQPSQAMTQLGDVLSWISQLVAENEELRSQMAGLTIQIDELEDQILDRDAKLIAIHDLSAS